MCITHAVVHRYIDDSFGSCDLTSFNQSCRGVTAVGLVSYRVTTAIDPDKNWCAGGIICRVGSMVENRLWNDDVEKQAVLGGSRVYRR